MRTVVLLLLLANVSLFVFTRLDSLGGGEAVRLSEQVRPDKIRILTPQEVAALGPAKVAALADVCLEWGPFADAERTRALADLDALHLGALLTQRRIDAETMYWVNLGAFPTRAAADKRAADLRTQGVADVSVVDKSGQPVVSLGLFRTEQAARTRADALAAQNVRNAHVETRSAAAAQTMLVVRDPQQAAVARVKELQPQYAGTDVRVGTCPVT